MSFVLNLASFLNISFVISLCLGRLYQPLHDKETTEQNVNEPRLRRRKKGELFYSILYID